MIIVVMRRIHSNAPNTAAAVIAPQHVSSLLPTTQAFSPTLTATAMTPANQESKAMASIAALV